LKTRASSAKRSEPYGRKPPAWDKMIRRPGYRSTTPLSTSWMAVRVVSNGKFAIGGATPVAGGMSGWPGLGRRSCLLRAAMRKAAGGFSSLRGSRRGGAGDGAAGGW
jgi:hypothetical protein